MARRTALKRPLSFLREKGTARRTQPTRLDVGDNRASLRYLRRKQMNMPFQGPGRQSFDDEGLARIRICARFALAQAHRSARAITFVSCSDDHGVGEIWQAGIGLGGVHPEHRTDVTPPGTAVPGMKSTRQGASRKALEDRVATSAVTRQRRRLP
jgi:hypothetical protein